MNYQNYAAARDAAWRVLLDCKIGSLPVRPSVICKHYGWALSDYKGGARTIELLGLSDFPLHTDGFCTITAHRTYIFFDSTLPIARQRFTIAHEIGHLILGHVGVGQATVANREPTGTESPQERQANQFAARLLAPACVLHELGILTASAIEQACGMSRQAAEVRAKRMLELERRGRWYTSPLEREVLRQFGL